jgi:hypothetical protein
MKSLLSCHVILYFFVFLYLFIVLWRRKRVACLVQIGFVFCMEIYKMFQVFHYDRGQLVSYVDNFYVRSMSMRQEWVFLLVLGHEPIKEVYNQK